MNVAAHNAKDFSVLCAVENYPGSTNGAPVSHQFVHVRNLYYRSLGIDVTVLNFTEKASYNYEGISVIGVEEFDRRNVHYDVLLCHQPNLKHHLPFCKRHFDDFHGVVFFFHGHEVLKLSKVYPKPYSYVKRNYLKTVLRDIYDDSKFCIWHHYFKQIKDAASFVFVSQWMYDEFMKWLRVDRSFLADHAYIIPNCIGSDFEINRYTPESEKSYDFITIRGNLDTSKYAIDLVVKSALANPELKYLVVGKGEFFKHFQKPKNIIWMNTTLTHSEIIYKLNQARCALMPTRTDAQGLMMCEMASFGIPLITSDIPVCHEVLDQFGNVRFVANDGFGRELSSILCEIPSNCVPVSPYSKRNTIGKEVALMRKIVQEFSA